MAQVPAPETGERILVLKDKWLLRILLREKTMEVRGRRLSGSYLLGCRGRIYARATLGEAVKIDSLQIWQELRHMHRVSANKLPYAKTYGMPLTALKFFPHSIPYRPLRGAVGVVIYRG